MEQVLTSDDLLDFEAITQFPVTAYIASIKAFVTKDVPNIIGYYSGDIPSLNSNSNNNLQQLLLQNDILFSSITANKGGLRNYKYWILIDNLEQTENMLLKLNTASKWLRSTISNSTFNPNPEVQISFKQGQTLESIQRDVLGSDNWDDSWTDLAVKNDLREEDYTSQGGFLLKANFNYTLNNFKLNSIVDNPVDVKVLGIDLPTKLVFDTVAQDYVILSPQDTFFQTVSILINMRQGDNPEFPDHGLSANLVIGTNINSLSYPAIFRQLTALFKLDDTIKTFTLQKISRQQDAVFFEFEVQSLLGDLRQISLATA